MQEQASRVDAPARRVVSAAGRHCADQSLGRGLPSLGVQAQTQVWTDIPGFTPLTLPSPRPTCMVPVCPPCVTYQLQACAEGPAWKPTLPCENEAPLQFIW